MVSLVTFSSSYFVFIQLRRGIFNSFAFSNNVVLLIYNFFDLKLGYKKVCLYLKISIIN